MISCLRELIPCPRVEGVTDQNPSDAKHLDDTFRRRIRSVLAQRLPRADDHGTTERNSEKVAIMYAGIDKHGGTVVGATVCEGIEGQCLEECMQSSSAGETLVVKSCDENVRTRLLIASI